MLQQEWVEMDYWLDVKKKKLGEGLFLSVVRIFQSFPPFKCIDFINNAKEPCMNICVCGRHVNKRTARFENQWRMSTFQCK